MLSTHLGVGSFGLEARAGRWRSNTAEVFAPGRTDPPLRISVNLRCVCVFTRLLALCEWVPLDPLPVLCAHLMVPQHATVFELRRYLGRGGRPGREKRGGARERASAVPPASSSPARTT